MARRDQVLSLFGATPAQVLQRIREEDRQFMSQMQTPESRVGFGLGRAIGRAFGGEDPRVAQARQRQEVMRNFNEFGAEVEKEAAERGMAPLDEVQMLNKRANELDAMSNRFSALGQPQDIVQNMSNEALKTRFLALDKQREMQKFEQDQQKYQLDMQVAKERLEQLQERDKLTPLQHAEIQLKATPESYQAWLKGEGPLVPNPKMSSDVNKVIQTFEYYMNLPPEKQKQFLMVKRAVPIVDTGASVSFRNPADPTQEVLNIPKQIPPAQTPEAKAAVTEAEVTTEAVTKDKLAAPGQIMALDMFDTQLADLAGHPGFQNAFGFGGAQLSSIPGSPAFGASSLLEQVKGSAFLNAIPQMKGLGALSDAEGRAITQSVTRLQQGLAPEEARGEITKMRLLLGQQRARIESKQFLTPEQVRNMPLSIPQLTQRTAGGTTYEVISE